MEELRHLSRSAFAIGTRCLRSLAPRKISAAAQAPWAVSTRPEPPRATIAAPGWTTPRRASEARQIRCYLRRTAGLSAAQSGALESKWANGNADGSDRAGESHVAGETAGGRASFGGKSALSWRLNGIADCSQYGTFGGFSGGAVSAPRIPPPVGERDPLSLVRAEPALACPSSPRIPPFVAGHWEF
jgi:hypothetical protein